MTALDQIKQRNLKICFDGRNTNWYLCSDSRGYVWSISKDGNTEGNTQFGDKNHIKRLINFGHFDRLDSITESGRELMSGLYSQLMTDSKGKKFSIIAWYPN